MNRAILAGCLAVACSGADGTAGPVGPIGPEGPTGPSGTSHVFTAIAGSLGSATVTLPAAAGTDKTKPPTVLCYDTDLPSSGSWSVVGGPNAGAGIPYCGMIMGAGGTWTVFINQMPSGWTAAFVAIY